MEATRFGGPEVLAPATRPDPVAEPGTIVVRIRAATVNPTDLTARSGEIRARVPDLTPPFVPGWDLAGVVESVGEGTDGLRPGDRVIGMIPWRHIGGRVGAYAEAAQLDATWAVPMPPGLDDVVAATLPLNVLTADQALRMIAAPPGSTLLITGASGAVGGFATQLAVRAGIRTLAVAGRDDEAWLRELGPDQVLPRDVDFREIEPVDAVFDAVPIGPRVAAAVRDGGIVVYTRAKPPAEGRDVRFATVWIDPDQAALRGFAADLGNGRLRTRVADVLPLADAARAHRLTEAGGLRGKLVLTP
jgi:NADPH:quinone reductase-like Zn-dependent oxidoreductase